VTHNVDYQLIVGHMYKLGTDGIHCRCILEHENYTVLYEEIESIAGEHNVKNVTTQKVIHEGLWWPSLFEDSKEYCKHCDVFQRIGKPYRRDEIFFS
jgi:hypothetical protein